MIDWNRSYTATWKVFRVNRDTWADAGAMNNVDGFSLSRTASGTMVESGRLRLSGDFDSDYYRVVMIAEQGGNTERVNIATLLFDISNGERDYGVDLYDVSGLSVLYPASTTAVTNGEYAPAGCNGAEYVRGLLQGAINAPVVADSNFTLNNHIVHDLGSSVLEAAWSVLNAGDFILQISGEGIVHVTQKPTEPSLIIDGSSYGVLMNKITYSYNYSEIPNRYIVVDDNIITMAVNDNPESAVSTVSRGYSVDVVDTSPTPVNGETYNQYAVNMLKKMSVLKEERNYTREYSPDVYPWSIVRSSISGLDGDYRVDTQTINCGNGITVSEKAIKETQLW